MKLRHTTLLVGVLALLSAAIVTPVALARATSAAPSTGASVPVTGTATNTAGQAVTFAGTFTIDRVVAQNGQLAAVGTLAGTLTNTVTGVTQTVTQALTLPLAATGSCQILHLTLGPLDLNLLGLMVHLNQVVLDITAQQGPGNLLGNLLCAVAGLLDSGGPLAGIAQLLNQILSQI